MNSTPKPADRTGERILAAVLALAAVGVLWWELEPLVLFRPADAVVLSTGTYRSKRYVGRGGSHPYVGGRVFYRYELEGQAFVGHQYRRTGLFGDLDETRRYARADRVRIWYHPLNRTDAVVSRRPEWLLVAPCVLMLILWARLEWVEGARRRSRAALFRHYGRGPID